MLKHLFSSRFSPSSSSSFPLCNSYYLIRSFLHFTSKFTHLFRQVETNKTLQDVNEKWKSFLSPPEFLMTIQSSSLDEYTKKALKDFTELTLQLGQNGQGQGQGQEGEEGKMNGMSFNSPLLIKPATDQIKIIWDGLQTTVQSQYQLMDILTQLKQKGNSMSSQIQMKTKTSIKLDLFDLIPAAVLDEKTKESLRDLTKLGEKIQSQFAKSTIHFQHPFLVNLGLLRLYVMQTPQLQNITQQDGLNSQIDETFLSKSKYYLKYAADVYDESVYISAEDILLNELTEHPVTLGSNVKIPRHIVFLDHLTKSIVISIRGTGSISDILTDLHLDSIPFDITPVDGLDPNASEAVASHYNLLKSAFLRAKEALKELSQQKTDARAQSSSSAHLLSTPDPHTHLYAHNGMAQSAQALLPGILEAIREGHRRKDGRYRGYEVVLTGHSLGGGTACLLSFLLASKYSYSVTTYAFAPPPVINTFSIPSKTLEKCRIHSFIHNHDIIPRASHSEFLNLLSAMSRIDSMEWKAVDRTMILMRGYLTEEERVFIKGIVEKKDITRNFHVENDEIDMIVPGNLYLLSPVRISAVSPDSTQDSKNILPLSSGKILTPEKPSAGSGSLKPLKKSTSCPYQIRSIPSTEAMSLYNGFFYTGDSMVSDHLVSAYLASMINLRSS